MKDAKKIINIRPLFAVFFGLILGILFATRFCNSMSYNNIIILCVIGCVIVWSVVIMILYLFSNKIAIKYIVPAVIIFVTFLLGAGYSQIKIGMYKANTLQMSDVVVIGKIDDMTATWVTISDVEVIDSNDNSYRLSHKVNLYVGNNADVIQDEDKKYGNVVSFSCNLKPLTLSDSNMSYLANGVGYLVFPSTNVSVVDYKPNIKDSSYNYIKSTLSKVDIPSDIQAMELAMLFGDKSAIGDMYNLFTRTGTGHILAVSGLHIMCLVLALSYLCKWLHIRKYFKLAVIGVILLVYNILCGFSPSVVRASLMSICTMIGGDILGEAYDVTSSISLAGSIILLFSPFMIFDIGFILSFLCVFAIITLAPYLTKIFSYLRLPKFLSNSLGLSLAVSIGIFPMSCQYFTSVSFISLLANVVVIPLFTLVYIVLFASLVIVSILPFMYWLLYVPYACIYALVYIISLYSKLEFLILYTRPLSINSFISLFAFMIIIKYLMTSIPIKATLCTILAIIFALSVGERYFTKYYGDDRLLCFNNMIIVEDSGKYDIIATNAQDIADSFVSLSNKYINNIDRLILLNYSDNDYDDLYDIVKYYFVNCVIVPQDIECSKIAKAKVLYGNQEDITFESGGAVININDQNICILDTNCTALDVDYFSKFSYNYLVMTRVQKYNMNIQASKYINIAPYDPQNIINDFDQYDFVSTIFYPNGVSVLL